MRSIYIKRGAPGFLRECAIEVSAIIGFRSVSIEFPVLRVGDAPVATRLSGTVFVLEADEAMDGDYGIRLRDGVAILSLRDGTGTAGLLNALCSAIDGIDAGVDFYIDSRYYIDSRDPQGPLGSDSPAPAPAPAPASNGAMESGYHRRPLSQGLEALFEREYIVKDGDFDFLPDVIDASIELAPDMDDFELSAACDIAARLGIESLGLQLPIASRAGRVRGTTIRIQRSSGCRVSLRERPRVIELRGEGEALSSMASALCRRLPGTGDASPLAELCEGLRRALPFGSLDGQLSWLAAMRPPAGAVAYVEPRFELRRPAIEKRFPGIEFRSRSTLEAVAGREIDLPWELESCRAILEDDAYPMLGRRLGSDGGIAGAATDIVVVIGEDKPGRAALEAEIRAAAIARGAVSPRVRVVSAFKQGLSWIRDYALPELAEAAAGRVASVDVLFSAFLPAGRGAWNDEDGATPKIAANRPADPDRWLDPPIRLLQELYPADDIIASVLGIGRDSVRFALLEGGLVPGYRLVARDSAGAVVYEDSYDISVSERPYLDDFPELGKVHPGTGRVSLSFDGSSAGVWRFKTDMECVWDAYQLEALPACRAIAEAAGGGAATASCQPFFARLRVEVEASEQDEDLGIRQDRVSSLESLHEDIYFAGLDYFQTLGVKATGKGFDAPGLILPVIRKAEGRVRMRYSIQAERPGRAGFEAAGRRLPSPGSGTAGSIDAFVDELAYDAERGEFSPRIRVLAPGPDADAFIASYAELLSEGLLEASAWASHFRRIRFALGDGPSFEAAMPGPSPALPAVDIRDIDLMEGKLIGPEQFYAIAESLRRVEGVCVRKVAESRQGRDVLAVEIASRLPGYVSRTKLVASRPSIIINARHHANEVSSTNSALSLIRRLLTDEAYADADERLNIVVIPFENPDGAAVHYELAADNPEWILHPARYDSLGKEISYEYFNDDTEHGEARGFTRVWRDWLPDVIVDDHGVPTHEWCQQFSGYTSPWFKGFWMPRALLYGYFWYCSDAEYAGNKALSERIQEAVADRIDSEPEYRALNAEWRDRFEKYAHAWMPRLFPAEYHRDVIFYWVPFAYKADYHYVSVRYPWITAACLVTEVADETATGDYLGLCSRTHEDGDLAVIDLLGSSAQRMISAGSCLSPADPDAWTVTAKLSRERPLRADGEGA